MHKTDFQRVSSYSLSNYSNPKRIYISPNDQITNWNLSITNFHTHKVPESPSQTHKFPPSIHVSQTYNMNIDILPPHHVSNININNQNVTHLDPIFHNKSLPESLPEDTSLEISFFLWITCKTIWRRIPLLVVAVQETLRSPNPAAKKSIKKLYQELYIRFCYFYFCSGVKETDTETTDRYR